MSHFRVELSCPKTGKVIPVYKGCGLGARKAVKQLKTVLFDGKGGKKNAI
jgi:hypothetical protein